MVALRSTIAATPRLSWNPRVTPGDQELIDRAVSASGLTHTDFALQAARAAAQELLVEQTWSAMDGARGLRGLLPPARCPGHPE